MKKESLFIIFIVCLVLIAIPIVLFVSENIMLSPPPVIAPPTSDSFARSTPIFEIRVRACDYTGVFSAPFSDFVWNATAWRYEYRLSRYYLPIPSGEITKCYLRSERQLATINNIEVFFDDTIAPYELKYTYNLSLGNLPVDSTNISVYMAHSPVPSGLYGLTRIYSGLIFHENEADSDNVLNISSGDYHNAHRRGLAYFATSSGYERGGPGSATCDQNGCSGNVWSRYHAAGENSDIPGNIEWLEITSESRAKPGDNYLFTQQFIVAPR